MNEWMNVRQSEDILFGDLELEINPLLATSIFVLFVFLLKFTGTLPRFRFQGQALHQHHHV